MQLQSYELIPSPRGRGQSEGEQGFLLIEVLMALVIFAIVSIASFRAISQSLKVVERSEGDTRAILNFENLLYELETGESSDLFYYGGKGKSGGFDYEIKSLAIDSNGEKDYLIKGEENLVSSYLLDIRLSWKLGKDFLGYKLLLNEGGAV